MKIVIEFSGERATTEMDVPYCGVQDGRYPSCDQASDTARLILVKPESHNDLYCILHELGHLVDNKINPSHCINYGIEQKASEIAAWTYVFQCVKPKYWKEVIAAAEQCYWGTLFT